MPILTDQILATSLNLTDFVHIARPEDLSQSDNGSSYKATIAQLIDANDCCLSSGTYDYENQTLNLFGVTGTLGVQVINFPVFTGGSSNCINNLYLNNIFPCIQHVFIQPIADGAINQLTRFGITSPSSQYSPMIILHTESSTTPNTPLTKWGVNNTAINFRSTFHISSPGNLSEFRFYDDLIGASGTLFDDLQEVIMLSSGVVSTALKVVSDDGAGLILGAIDPSVVLSSLIPFGTTRDTFLAKVGPSNGLNIVSTNEDNDSGFIAFFLNGDWQEKSGQPEVYISGSDPTKGYMGVGLNNVTPTSRLDINGIGAVAGTVGFSQLRLRTPYTPKNSGVDPLGQQGDICWDNNGLYIKVTGALWRRLPLTTF